MRSDGHTGTFPYIQARNVPSLRCYEAIHQLSVGSGCALMVPSSGAFSNSLRSGYRFFLDAFMVFSGQSQGSRLPRLNGPGHKMATVQSLAQQYIRTGSRKVQGQTAMPDYVTPFGRNSVTQLSDMSKVQSGQLHVASFNAVQSHPLIRGLHLL